MKNIYSHIKKKLISGILILIPLIITFIIVKFLFEMVDKVFAIHINTLIKNYFSDFKEIRGIGFIVSIALIYFIGLLGSSVIIKKFIRFGENILSKIPLIKAIYSSVRQLVDAISMTSSTSFRQVVYVEYPKEGVFVLAFLTNELTDKSGEKYCSVFVPTTPNPTSGYLLFYPKSDVVIAEMTVDEAFKAIMSGAIVFQGELPMNDKSLLNQVNNTVSENLT